MTQYKPLSNSHSLDFSITVTDKDGDIATASNNVTLQGGSHTDSDNSNVIKTGDSNDTVKLHSEYHNINLIDSSTNGTIEINGVNTTDHTPNHSGFHATTGQINAILEDDKDIALEANDTIYTYGGNDHVEGGKGNDTIYLGDPSSVASDNNIPENARAFVDGSDNEVFELSSDTLKGKFAGPAWADAAHGSYGNDKIYGEAGTDLISGGADNDFLDGGDGQDFIRGGSGNDIIIGGAGDDFMRGGSGSDTFVWNESDIDDDALVTDVIVDFEVDKDILDISDLLDGDDGLYIEIFENENGNATIRIDVDYEDSDEEHSESSPEFDQEIELSVSLDVLRGEGIIENKLFDSETEATLSNSGSVS